MFSIVLGPHAHISYLSMLFVLSLFVHICKKIKSEMELNCNQNIKKEEDRHSLKLIHTSLTATHSAMRTISAGKAYMIRMFTFLALERASLTSLWIEAYRWLSWSGCNLIRTLPGRSGTLPIPVKQSEDRSQIKIPLSLVLTAKKRVQILGGEISRSKPASGLAGGPDWTGGCSTGEARDAQPPLMFNPNTPWSPITTFSNEVKRWTVEAIIWSHLSKKGGTALGLGAGLA